jgi:ribosome-binding protein aMBF1 (putative translation factor)
MNTSSSTRKAKKGKRPARAEIAALRERLEDIENSLRALEAEARDEPALPAELVKRMIAGEHPVRIWREFRGLTASALAKKARMPVSYLSEIETRKKPGSVAAYAALAKALGVTVDDMV